MAEARSLFSPSLTYIFRYDDFVHRQSFPNHCPFFYLQKKIIIFAAMRSLTPSIITILFFILVQLTSAQSHMKRNSALQRRHTTHLAKRFDGPMTYYAVGLGACGNTNVPSDYVRLTLPFLAQLLINFQSKIVALNSAVGLLTLYKIPC